MTLDPHSFTLAQNVQDCNATVTEAKVFFRTDDAIDISNEAFSDLVSEFLLSKINAKLLQISIFANSDLYFSDSLMSLSIEDGYVVILASTMVDPVDDSVVDDLSTQII